MTRLEFLETLRRRLAGLPEAEIDDLLADYATHFADGMAAGHRADGLLGHPDGALHPVDRNRKRRSPDVDLEGGDDCQRERKADLRGGALAEGGVEHDLAPEPAYGDVTWVSAYDIDPFTVSPKEKVDLLTAWSAGLLAHPVVSHVNAIGHSVFSNLLWKKPKWPIRSSPTA